MPREKTIRTKGKRTALVDPHVRERLIAAADAAGLNSIDELADLVIDSGAAAIPPPDGVTESYTLEDLGEQMHAQMPSDASDRPRWFMKDLVQTQQVALVVMLRARGYSSIVIARDFCLAELEVNKIYSRYVDDLGGQVINVRLNTLVGNLQLAAERSAEGAMKKEDWGTYWRVQKELIALLQSLGIVKQAIRKVEVAHKFEDQQKAEVEQLLDLERKQVARREEIKMAEVQVIDETPRLDLPQAPGSMEDTYVE